MKRKHEEELIKLAFGDLSQEESHRIEALAQDPEAAKALSQYRLMKEGLRQLNNIPESQLSKERLREALLKDGLKSRSRWAGIGWAATPVAIAALAFVLTLNRGHHSSLEAFRGKDVRLPKGSMVAKRDTPKVELTAPNTATTDVQRKMTATPVVASLVKHKTHHRKANQTEDRYKNLLADWMQGMGGSAGPRPTLASSDPSTDQARRDGMLHDETVVLIKNEKDSNGALKATESGSTSNVVVRG